MSWTHDPWTELPVLRAVDDGAFRWECESCGAESKEIFTLSSPLADVRASWVDHITGSHERHRPVLI